MIKWMLDFASNTLHMPGFFARLFVSFILSICALFLVILIGFLVNKLEQAQMKVLSKFFKPKTVFILCNYLTFFGVCVHELSHALAAWASGASVHKIQLFKIDDSNQLGCVKFSTRGSKFKQHVQLALVSCAPVVTGVLSVYILIQSIFFKSFPLWMDIIFWYFLISIIDHMSMSSVDIKNYLRGVLYIFPATLVIFWFFVYFFVR